MPPLAEAAPPLLQATALTRHFPITEGVLLKRRTGSVRAVDGVDLTVHPAETLGIVGESGCGKSTLASLLMALDRPTSGSVVIDGLDPFSLSSRELRTVRRRVQMVLQDPYTSLNPRMTAGQIVGEPFAIHPEAAPKADRGRRVDELLETVGLDPTHRDRYPHQFSGGQRQRLGIARALALGPRLLLCDEPVSALDVSVQAQVLNLLQELRRDLRLACVFISHDLAVVQHLCDRIAVMYLGKIVETGTREQIYTAPRHPYTRALLAAAPVPDPTRRAADDQHLLEGDLPSPATPPSGCRFRTRCPYAREQCLVEPELRTRDGADHPTACHFPIESTATRRNA
ncbi:oligopeptide/dipeptide ABC transporter ATP-binding protein [Streptomyces sp. NPDC039028]|uniref:ABC transporter ATP-binding protein n=1 Tax=unclassified Streptomyces TaxID=2593676 RepID=UPI0034027820